MGFGGCSTRWSDRPESCRLNSVKQVQRAGARRKGFLESPVADGSAQNSLALLANATFEARGRVSFRARLVWRLPKKGGMVIWINIVVSQDAEVGGLWLLPSSFRWSSKPLVDPSSGQHAAIASWVSEAVPQDGPTDRNLAD